MISQFIIYFENPSQANHKIIAQGVPINDWLHSCWHQLNHWFQYRSEVLFHDPHEKASQVFNRFFTPVKGNLGPFGPKSSWNTQNQYYLSSSIFRQAFESSSFCEQDIFEAPRMLITEVKLSGGWDDLKLTRKVWIWLLGILWWRRLSSRPTVWFPNN